jgi:hypothetical protein
MLWQLHDSNRDEAIRAFNRGMVARLKESGGIKDGVTQYNNNVGKNRVLADFPLYYRIH